MSVARQSPREAIIQVPSLPARALQELWFATRRREWRTLVLMPASSGTSVLPVAKALGEVGAFIRGSPVHIVDGERMDLGRIAALVTEINGVISSSARTVSGPGTNAPGGWEPAPRVGATIIALEAVVDNPLVLPVTLAADAVVLCIEMGRTELAAARHTVDLIGRDRIIGSVILRR